MKKIMIFEYDPDHKLDVNVYIIIDYLIGFKCGLLFFGSFDGSKQKIMKNQDFFHDLEYDP